MALREERPAEFTDEERWGRYLTTTSLIGLLSFGFVCIGICRFFMMVRLLPVGLVLSIIIMLSGVFIFLVPVPEGDLWHGQGTLFAKILMRIVVRRGMGRIYVRLMSRMGDETDTGKEESNGKKRRKKGNGRRTRK